MKDNNMLDYLRKIQQNLIGNSSDGKTILASGENIVLAQCKKQEFVTWAKDANGGYCWGHYFMFGDYTGNTELQAFESAWADYQEREQRGF